MLLPSGRSNSDVQPAFLTRTASPQLSATAGQKSPNGCYAPPTMAVSAPAPVPAPVPAPTATSTSSTPTSAAGAVSLSAAAEATATTLAGSGSSGGRSDTGHGLLSNHSTNGSKAAAPGNWTEVDRHLEALQAKLKDGWSVHVGKEGRLYYCNHMTQTSGWLPSCEDWSRHEQLPYGWERAVDSKGRSYYINHLNKTSTYEAPESVRWDENPPEPRVVVLQRSATMGFGFVAGSERPVIVRFVTEDGPSINKLQPGDQILAVNGEDVKDAPRDRVIQLVRACETQVTLLVCQPVHTLTPGRKSTLLSAGKRAKLRTRPSRVRFAESVCVNGAPLFPPSAFSLGDICVPPMANVLKVFLENGQTKSFKYDTTTTVQDVVTSLLDKLCFTSGELFSLVLEHVKSLKRNKLTLLDPEESLARIASRPGAHKLRCLFRVTFVPVSAAELAQRDLNALDYLYLQCCNDVTQERFAPELQPEVALRLAALHMHQHALANNVSPAKLTVKVVEREFGLERFVPASLFEGMKRKELRRLVSHFLKMNAEMTGSSTKVLTQLQTKLHYLDIIAGLPSYGAKCFSTNQRDGLERVLLVSPRFGLSQISNVRNSVPQPVSAIEDLQHVIVNREDDVSCSVTVLLQGDRMVRFSMEDRDAAEFSLVLAGYYRLLTGQDLPLVRERERSEEDNAPSYLAQHTVLPAAWSYLPPAHNRAHSINFLTAPPYHPPPAADLKQQLALAASPLCDSNMNSPRLANGNNVAAKVQRFAGSAAMDLDIHSVVATELLEEAKDSGLSDSSGGGSNCCEQSGRPTNGGGSRSGSGSSSATIDAKNEEVLRRVHEMQQMVENSEQYLNEQGELVHDYSGPEGAGGAAGHLCGAVGSWPNDKAAAGGAAAGRAIVEFDSDCDSLNSSKVSSAEAEAEAEAEETPLAGGPLKHSDSLVLLAEAINHDLSGIAQGLDSIGGGQAGQEGQAKASSLSATSSPRPERRLNGFSQLLSNLQALGTDFSQSESDSESVASPTNSPTTRRPALLSGGATVGRKQNVAYRSSFGLHSPDGSNFGAETKDYNLKEYLRQLKEISNVASLHQDTDEAAKKLSEIYGFEIRGDTFIETDSDLIDLRAIPPPQTPDELDALSLLNAAPQGFDDVRRTAVLSEVEGDLDQFLAKVVVAPPTQKATPAKELTPEEIMSFIIPPPPNLEESDKPQSAPESLRQSQQSQQSQQAPQAQQASQVPQAQQAESLYSNSATAREAQSNRRPPTAAEKAAPPKAAVRHVIEYETVERKSKFSCCPKSRKDESGGGGGGQQQQRAELKLPPRSQSLDQSAPARPPKSAELLQRYSPKKQVPPQPAAVAVAAPEAHRPRAENPPSLPPRTHLSSGRRGGEERIASATLSPPAPKKPPLPPIATRPVLRPTDVRATTPSKPSTPPAQPAAPSSLPPPTQPRLFAAPNSRAAAPPPLAHHSNGSADFREKRPPHPLLCSPQMGRKHNACNDGLGNKLIVKNGHVIDGEALLAKTDVAMAGLLVKLDQVAAQCSAAQAAGGGANIDEDKFQRARNELTEQTLVLVTASKFLVVAMSDLTLATLPEHLTSCLTAIRRITELTQDMTRHTSAPLQTRNIVLKVHDVASSFRELVGVQIGPRGAGQLALQAECLANVLATLLRSLRVFSP